MPSTMLFAVNTEGRVYGLSTNGKNWREFPYVGLDFKVLSAVPNFLWAVGSDRQIYVHVHCLDIPIRIKEEAYENHRWYPFEGFSARLLPTDRFSFSSEDGLTDRNLEKIRVPSLAWQWEGPWKIETVLNGEPLDHDGWTYAFDFPATFHSTYGRSSCVRRRKWVRSRKYCAMNSWCAIAPLHHDPTKETFTDVSVGAQSLVDMNQDSFSVWAVTTDGRVVWRKDVSRSCPEGTGWKAVPLPKMCEAKHIGCGSTGLVWVILWSGKALVRIGVTASSLLGTSWVDVDPPEDLKLTQVSVGYNSVWIVTSDKRVWFRKGVKGEAEASEELAKGSGWVEMVGHMSMVSVTWCDQVFAVGTDDRSLYFRLGVNPMELTGKKWKHLYVNIATKSRASSISSSSKLRRSTASLNHNEDRFDWETSRSAPTSMKGQRSWQDPDPGSASLPASEGSVEEPSLINSTSSDEKPSLKLKAWSPIRSGSSLVGLEANPETDPDVDWEGIVYPEREKEHLCEPEWSQADMLWSCVEAGALVLNPDLLPNWFVQINPSNALESAPWREKLLSLLLFYRKKIHNEFQYEPAIEITSTIKQIEGKFYPVGKDNFEECSIEMEWIGNNLITIDTCTLSIFSVDKTITKSQLSMTEVILIDTCGPLTIAIHTLDSSAKNLSPLKLLFGSDTDLDDWLAHLSSIHAKIFDMEGAPSKNSIWGVTKMGNIFVFDTSILKSLQSAGDSYVTELNCKSEDSEIIRHLSNGFSPGSSIDIIGFTPDNIERFSINLDCGNENTVALHFNPRYEDHKIVRNSFENGNWGAEETEGHMNLQKGNDFRVQILCQNDGFKIFVEGMVFTYFMHRILPQNITQLRITGKIDVHKIFYESTEVIVPLGEMVWKQIGGHLMSVETCAIGVTWGISADNTPYCYTGGWGGAFLRGLQQNTIGINPLMDTHVCYVYENQRWNPINGFTSRGLPTDRPMWSDSTGHYKKSKETTRLLSMHWQWINEWSIDFCTPGGVDSEGWQYAIDFSTTYHARKNMTDYVRRRRWYRKCKLSTSGPWEEVGNTKIVDISLQCTSALSEICVWAIALNGDALFRMNVTNANPMGDLWDHVPCDQKLSSISCGCGNQVWAVTLSGSCYWRFGITTSNPKGEIWEIVEPPKGTTIKKVSVARWAVWALDINGSIYIRREVSPVFPEGTHWQPITQDGFEIFNDVSASGDEVWAITSSGTICRRLGVTCEDPAGISWLKGITADWKNISIRSYTSKTLPKNK